VLIDLWGHGLSDAVLAPHEPSLFHGLIDALLDKLEWPSTHLVGFSFGGALTAGYVTTRPSKVSSFTLVAPAGLIPYSSLTDDEKATLKSDDEEVAQTWTVSWLEGGDLIVPEDWKEKVANGEVVAAAVKKWQMAEHPGHTATVRAVVRDGGVFDVDSQSNFKAAAGSAIPYYGIVGEFDPVCCEDGLKRVGFKHVSVVQGAGHEVVRARASEVAALITDFWGKQYWLDRA
jgi:pimeloyl-ACP methyl ester carboxylesterase